MASTTTTRPASDLACRASAWPRCCLRWRWPPCFGIGGGHRRLVAHTARASAVRSRGGQQRIRAATSRVGPAWSRARRRPRTPATEGKHDGLWPARAVPPASRRATRRLHGVRGRRGGGSRRRRARQEENKGKPAWQRQGVTSAGLRPEGYARRRRELRVRRPRRHLRNAPRGQRNGKRTPADSSGLTVPSAGRRRPAPAPARAACRAAPTRSTRWRRPRRSRRCTPARLAVVGATGGRPPMSNSKPSAAAARAGRAHRRAHVLPVRRGDPVQAGAVPAKRPLARAPPGDRAAHPDRDPRLLHRPRTQADGVQPVVTGRGS